MSGSDVQVVEDALTPILLHVLRPSSALIGIHGRWHTVAHRPSLADILAADAKAHTRFAARAGAFAQLPSERGAVNDADAILDQSTMAPLLSYV